jgi:hypothetical protein
MMIDEKQCWIWIQGDMVSIGSVFSDPKREKFPTKKLVGCSRLEGRHGG